MVIASRDRLDRTRPDQPGPHCRRSCLKYISPSCCHTDKSMAAAAALAEVHQALQWIGFGNQVHRDSICEEAGFESLEDFVGLSEKDI